jgi:hypothetical protein
MLEVHRNVVTSNVGGHGDDGSCVELSNQVACRYTIKVRHNNIHQDQVVLGSIVHFVDSFKSVKLGSVSAEHI